MAFVEKMALEAGKPVVGFFNAMLEPKIEKVRVWAEKKELKNQLDPEALSETLGSYLSILSSRVSFISSICFPQKQFSIDEAYEPLFLESYNPHYLEEASRLPISKIINNLNQSCLILDSAGMGKSTFSKYLITQILYKSDRIPVLYELRKSKKGIDLIESIARELDPLGRVFSRELFYELLKHGKFIIVLDGFDEVPLERQQDMANEINSLSIKGMKNTLVLTSRPQELIPEIVDVEIYRFSSFSIEQAKSLVLKLDHISNLDVGKRLINEFDNVPDKFLENPLLVSLLYTTFGANNSIADRICTFYDEVYQALYKGHDLINKNGFVRDKDSNLDFEQFRVLLRSLCFQMILKRKTAFSSWSEAIDYVNNAIKSSKVEPKSASAFLNDLINAVPLMQKDGSDYKFLHKTIIEYFAAEYIVYKPNSEALLQKMFDSKSFSAFKTVFDFVYDISSSLYDKVITKYHAEKLLSNFEFFDEKYSTVVTSNYLCALEFGIYPVSDYSETPEAEKPEPFHSKMFNKRPKPGVMTAYSWIIVKYDHKEYFVMASATSVEHRIHSIAWDQLTVDVSPNLTFNENENIDELFDFLDIEKNYKLSNLSFVEVAKHDILMVLLLRFATGGFSMTIKDDNKFLLSKSKIELFLETLKTQLDIDDELESLL
ncbi:hypothetical protein GNP61_12125 [Aliivibrio fischeri]|uniref:NACHT domain-containing protein n=1 Tax=Aliivibrio fischeri TaxID=668 RepID=UPI0012DA52AF|nr:hypothetical protein [Aliivibrio fischeri]MUK42296.1 hypothetical protein [Aliivibrio fischeri]